jgi:alpha-tubulin suppressor-like RCC1 family protein
MRPSDADSARRGRAAPAVIEGEMMCSGVVFSTTPSSAKRISIGFAVVCAAIGALLAFSGPATATSRSSLLAGSPSTPASSTSAAATTVAAGGFHTCAITGAGAVKCWGDNIYGQLGDDETCGFFCFTPIDVSGLASGIQAVTAGDLHTCALTSGGGVKCWGYNGTGALGDGTTTDRHTPADVSGLTSGITALAAGSAHTCALTSAGGVKCWGWNISGQLGDGTTTSSATPVDVSGLSTGVIAIAAGDTYTCALKSAGGVKCWGNNGVGQLGDGQSCGNTCLFPVDVSGLTSGVTAISAGDGQTCALTTAHGAKCWGLNVVGEVGDGTTTDRYVPVDVFGLDSGVAALAAGGFHTCALTSAGGAKCWGWNRFGQLGNGASSDSSIPIDVFGLASGTATLSAGGRHTCARTASPGLVCWGQNGFGQLGDGSSNNSSVPVNVIGAWPPPPPPNQEPNCSAVTATPNSIWPATRDQMALITLSGATDADGDTLGYHIDAVTQDEYVTGVGDDTFPDAALRFGGASSNQVLVRSEANPQFNGRVYRIAYTVSDGQGGTCSGIAGPSGTTTAKVSVPRKKGTPAIDNGDATSWNSFTGAPVS